VVTSRPGPRRSAFLDRDGTIIVEKHYLSDPDQVELERGVVEGLRLLSAAGFDLVVVSNQSGIGRGMFGMAQVQAVNARVTELLAAEGVHIAGWYVCPHEPLQNCQCRKPQPGLVRQAAEELNLDLAGAIVIGDKRSDVELANAIGGLGLLLASGHGGNDLDWANANGVPVFAGLHEAACFAAGLKTAHPVE